MLLVSDLDSSGLLETLQYSTSRSSPLSFSELFLIRLRSHDASSRGLVHSFAAPRRLSWTLKWGPWLKAFPTSRLLWVHSHCEHWNYASVTLLILLPLSKSLADFPTPCSKCKPLGTGSRYHHDFHEPSLCVVPFSGRLRSGTAFFQHGRPLMVWSRGPGPS